MTYTNYNTVDPLTQRELEVLSLISQGKPYKQIAKELGIKLSTVKNHVNNIRDKLGVQSRGEAAYLALTTGLLEDRIVLSNHDEHIVV